MNAQNKHPQKSKLPKWRRLATVYILLLVISYLVRLVYPSQDGVLSDQKTVTLGQTGSGRAYPQHVKIAYFDTGSDSNSNPPVTLLLHGSPLAARKTFRNLMPALSPAGRVIAPDLPGFGFSTMGIPDYSIRAHAEYIIDLLNRLNINQVNIVAHSMGSGVAINMAHAAPDLVRSVTLISALGVQELELLGNYHLNHALHAVQLALLWFLNNGFPHMGLLDKIPFNWSFARNFYDTDQRPLRKYLEEFEAPMLIIHGLRDVLIPVTAAREHFRIVPQSELKIYDGGHLMLFTHTRQLAGDINNFIEKVNTGKAKLRANAQRMRIIQAHIPFNQIKLPPATGVTLLILMILIALATLISEDLTCIGAGLMAARGAIGFMPAVAASFLGILLGDILLFLAGRHLGRPALRYPPLKWIIKEEDIARTSRWFSARGPIIITTSRFLPGSRLPTYVGAGMLGTGFWLFSYYFLIASLLWTPLLVGLSALIGSQMLTYFDQFRHYGILIVLGTAVFLWAVIKLVVPLFSFRGRRLLLAYLRRKIHYEFWPTYIFYIPIAVYILYLGLRYRSPTIFTASNPGIPEGGFVGESKSQILDGFQSHRDIIARYCLIKSDLSLSEKVIRAINFMSELRARFPIVLKPDADQRGVGVDIIKSQDQLENYLARARGDTIVQEYIDGYEYGVFYYRYPGHKRGKILTITDKRPLKLVGDGQNNLETLILKDDRAVCMAPLHFKVHEKNLLEIPAKGEVIQLVEVGTHARGALFLEGNDVWTPELETAIDRISKGFEGFYFGRYDIRTLNIEDFMQGKNFKIVELNGVTSEATHIYDPQNSICHVYKVLMKQWKIAFEIGALNVARGAKQTSPKKLFSLLSTKMA